MELRERRAKLAAGGNSGNQAQYSKLWKQNCSASLFDGCSNGRFKTLDARV